ncbi:hypothetical protein BGZ70_010526 [Mortierella alpina]|uniref:DUF7330 domain-containing protein n=1 Tax=Mortierella alpina TaxID=64518 RepID=A0A9P6J0Z9_MORAP|nr:hypothetical protein BGZ70_010526 [Mortierella alpina]
MSEKGPIAIPPGEEQPLLHQPGLGCTRGIFCKRCVSGAHSNSRTRTFARRTFVAVLIGCIYWSILGHNRPGSYHNGDHGSSSGDRQECRDHLVPWEGPSNFFTNASNIGFKFGKGNLVTSVGVTTSNAIKTPSIAITANVSKPYDPEQGNDFLKSALILDIHAKEYKHHGMHVRVREEGDSFDILIWADEDKHHHSHHHDRRRKEHHRFCANVEVLITLPESLTTFGRLAIEGAIMDVHTRALETVVFEQLKIESALGNIDIQDQGVQTRDFIVKSAVGPINISSVTAPAGAVLKANVSNAVGLISMNAIVPRLLEVEQEDGAELPQHDVELTSASGAVNLDIQASPESRSVFATLSAASVLRVKAKSEVGPTRISIDLEDEQVLMLDSSSVLGAIDVEVSDNFLGDLQLRTTMGSIRVVEAEESASIIEYEKNTRDQKIAKKYLRQDKSDMVPHDEAGGSHIHLGADFGRAALTFV